LRHFWYRLKGLLKGFWWPFRLLKSVKYSWSYGPNEVCNNRVILEGQSKVSGVALVGFPYIWYLVRMEFTEL